MKYLLDYLKEEMFIEPVEGTIFETDEEFEGDVPIGERLVLNHKDIDIVVWYVDYDRWLEKKYDDLLTKFNL